MKGNLLAVCRDYPLTRVVEQPEPVTVRVGEFPKLAPVVREIYWARQARVVHGKCGWKGWTEPWRISGPGAPRPTAEEITAKVADLECPGCGTAKKKD